MTLLQQSKLFVHVFRINVHFPKMAAILNFSGHFGSYINYYKSETFVDIFNGVLQEIALCRWLKSFFPLQLRPSWN